MRVRLHVVVEGDEIASQNVKESIHKIEEKFSFSPTREQPSLQRCVEFYASADLQQEEIKALKEQLNNDWEGEEDDCCAYGFNTKMFHPDVYYLQIEY